MWGIYIDDQTPEADKEIYKVTNDLRIRKQSPLRKLDIKATINRTIDNAGLLEPQYLFQTKPVEYLLLIDWSSQKNHQAQLFEFLYKTFKSHNVYIERFFYNADPRILWNQHYNQGISLEKLQQRFPEHYLLVFGNGAAFIDPLNHTLKAYTALFREWEQRALLTPSIGI